MLLQALEVLGERTSPLGLTRARVLLTYAYVRAELGHVSDGLRILDEIQAGENRPLAGLIAGQRGVLLFRAGRLEAAVEPIDAALRLLGRETPERAQMLLNRGLLRLSRGELEPARRDFVECCSVAACAGLDVLAGQARHNLGQLWSLSGDLPRALQEMDGAAEVLSRWRDLEYVYRVDRARVLFAAGLLDEADDELALAIRLIGRGGRRQDLAEVWLSRAQVALVAGRPVQARTLARRASQRFAERGSPGWARVADLAQAQALLALGRAWAVDIAALQEVAADLGRYGLTDDARMATLELIRVHLGTGDVSAAQARAAGALRLQRRDPIGIRLAVREARAELAAATGDHRRADSERSAGLRDLQQHQSTFGSLDLQTAVSVHGRGLAEAGLAAALRSGRPGQVLAWAERGRALASRVAPVRPPEDAQAADILAQLRFARRELRAAELAGRDEPTLRRRSGELERRIRHRSWYAAGPGDVEQPAGVEAVRGGLGESGVLVAHVVSQGTVHALVVSRGRAGVVALGPAEPVVERLRRVRADLDLLAGTGYPQRFQDTVLGSLRSGLAALDDALWQPLTVAARGDGYVVLVPAGALAAVPWTMLPALRGRPLTVARSATSWLLQRRRSVSPIGVRNHDGPAAVGDGPRATVVAASGPDLPHAETEVRAVAGLWPGGQALVGAEATGQSLLKALGSSEIVHVAAHGTHEVENPLFSSLRLADGPLFGYDLAGAAGTPRHVVLSACDLGRATERPGDELLGMTAAFLHAGTGSVLASVARVSDAVANELTVAYHSRLSRGESPAVALAGATVLTPAPFVCFGSGW